MPDYDEITAAAAALILDEIGVDVTYQAGGVAPGVTIDGAFANEGQRYERQGEDNILVTVHQGTMTCATADVPNLARDDKFVIGGDTWVVVEVIGVSGVSTCELERRVEVEVSRGE